jgi:glutamyl-tRNA reductase
MDQLSKMTDETLARRKSFIPQAEAINAEIIAEFTQWLETRKFAPVIKALKQKLTTLKAEELDFQSKKLNDFNEHQAEVISNRLIQKITTQFANHLKGNGNDADASLELIQQVFQLEIEKR